MVVNTGQSAADLALTVANFGLPHRIRRTVRVLDLDHQPVEDLTTAFLDGQVNVDQNAEVTRSATLSLFDPTHSLAFDTSDPTQGSVVPRYLLELTRGMYVDALDEWVDIPAGVLWMGQPKRSGDILTVEGQGKEAIARRPVVRELSFKPSAKKTDVIRIIMESIGETRFRISASAATVGVQYALDRKTSPWQACKNLAASMGWHIFYDASGYVVLRPKPTASVFTFRQGNGGVVRSEPEYGYATNEVSNYVLASGATPQGQNNPIIATARVDQNHPLYLERNGEPVWLRHDVSNDKLTTPKAVKQLADETLAQVVLEATTGSWESAPVWHLDQGDVVTITDAIDDEGTGASYSVPMPLKSFSIPLTLGNQSNGYNARVSRTSRLITRSAA